VNPTSINRYVIVAESRERQSKPDETFAHFANDRISMDRVTTESDRFDGYKFDGCKLILTSNGVA